MLNPDLILINNFCVKFSDGYCPETIVSIKGRQWQQQQRQIHNTIWQQNICGCIKTNNYEKKCPWFPLYQYTLESYWLF